MKCYHFHLERFNNMLLHNIHKLTTLHIENSNQSFKKILEPPAICADSSKAYDEDSICNAQFQWQWIGRSASISIHYD